MSTDDQQFCLRWNNFQAYITSQFEALRDDEDFVDVTLACEGRRLGAHKVVLSACSPFFKELFKSNPCPHPIIFMRDVEVRHVVALLEFMYAGEVNVAQAQLAGFLRTAESLQIRGLTDASSRHQENDIFPDHPTSTSPSRRKLKSHSPSRGISSVSSTLTSEEPTPTKRLKPEEEPPQEDLEDKLNPSINPFALQTKALHTEVDISAELIEPKIEPDYSEEGDEGNGYEEPAYGNLSGGMEIIPGTSGTPEISQESQQAWDNRKLHSLDPRPCPECGRVYSNLSNLRQHMRLIHNPTHVACPACRKGFKTALYLKRHLQACRARGGCHIPEGIGEGDITV